VAYRYGRLYCGWLCPHFSLVESLNGLLQRASGKLSFWDKHPTPRAGGAPDKRWWPAFVLACASFGFLWAITLLTYLLPPQQIWGNLIHGTLTPNQARFIGIGSLVFTAELMFARHLFCRFGCAVGLFQSLAWMANPKGLVVAFDRERARLPRVQHRRLARRFGLRHRLPDAPEAAQHQADDVRVRAVRAMPHRMRDLARRPRPQPEPRMEGRPGCGARDAAPASTGSLTPPWKSGSANAGTA